MSLSAQRIGKMFGLTAQEMNMALKLLGYLDGEPGNYLPTVKCKPFYLQRYYDNGYRGYANRTWSTVTYDESVIESLEQELTKEICQLAKDLVREHRAAKNTEISENVTIIAETIHSAIGKAQKNYGRQLSSKEIKTIVLVALIIFGTAATVTAVVLCVKNAKEKKSKETLTAAKIMEMDQARTAVCRKNEA